MRILMMTNTYAPMVGGIEESIRSFTAAFERLGHQVIIVAPECDGMPPDEVGVIRLRAIENFNHSKFSIALPMSHLLPEMMERFKPDIIHSHHPFWMGDIALRLSSQYQLPLVFTYHTMFEQHMHYLPVQNDGVKRFIMDLFAGYANLATQVIVPSESIRVVLQERGVTTDIAVVPTGVDLQKFAQGDGCALRERLGIPADAKVIGYIGRMALEKNLEFLTRCVAGYLQQEPQAHFLLGGGGPLKDSLQGIVNTMGVGQRVHWAGVLKDQGLVYGYHAMDIFSFASQSETQGIVLVEAMASHVPVVAVDAPGVREVVRDGFNGRLIVQENETQFIAALSSCLKQPPTTFSQMKINAQESSKAFAEELCAQRMLQVYRAVCLKEYAIRMHDGSTWSVLRMRLQNEWDMFKNMMHAGGAAMMGENPVTVEPANH